MRKHTLLCTLLASAMALASISMPCPASASPANSAAPSASASPSADYLEQMKKEDPEAYCQGNATEVMEQQATDSSDKKLSENNPALKKKSSLKKGTSSVSPFTGATYTHADAFDGMNIYHGVDVSYHQGNIDWAKVKAAGIDFAIIRMGYRGYSVGTLYTDTKFAEYMQGAINAGLKVGVYFFTEAITVDEAVAEAQYVLNAIAPYSVTMPVAIDWESNAAATNGGRKIAAGLTKEQNTLICSVFCDMVSSAGYTPMVYANRSDFTNRLDGAALGEKYEIWLARYNTVAEYANTYSFWQYSAGSAANKGTVNGISGNIDLNFWYTTSTIDAPAFAHSASGAAVAPPTPTPTPEPDEVDDVTGFSAASAPKKITLSWKKVKNATGYEISRKDTYNGSYKKVKTIANGETVSWKNTGLAKKHEYYYRIRAYITTSTDTIYSEEYTTLTAATKPSSQVGIAKKTLNLMKTPSKKGAKLVTAAAGTSLEYVGRTHLKNGNKFLHVRYFTTAKTYDGYLQTNAALKYYPCGTTTARLNLRRTAGTSGKLITIIPKNTPIALIGTKKADGDTWYKTSYSGKKGKIYSGYVSGNYISK